MYKVSAGYCPNHATGVLLPDFMVTPLQYVDWRHYDALLRIRKLGT